MIAVAGCWELGWSSPIKEYDLWRFLIDEYKIDAWFMCPVTGIQKKVSELSTMADIFNANEGMEIVHMDEKGEESLVEFEHPEDALYVFGKASYSPMRSIGGGRSVQIPTPTNGGRLWPHQALAILLHDRMVKNGYYINR